MKLPEAVEWLERDYDTYTSEATQWDCWEPERGLRRLYWFPREPHSGGPMHSQPMFTMKPNGGGPPFHWDPTQPVPLSLESESNPLIGGTPNMIMAITDALL